MAHLGEIGLELVFQPFGKAAFFDESQDLVVGHVRTGQKFEFVEPDKGIKAFCGDT